jgi:hypothetical protein
VGKLEELGHGDAPCVHGDVGTIVAENLVMRGGVTSMGRMHVRRS